jgi:anthranilate synthase component 2
MLLLLDNYDSFTYNLLQYLEEVMQEEIAVFRNNELTVEEAGVYDRFVLSPGPGLPEEAGILLPLIRTYASTKPMLGVCLGHQALAMSFGGQLRQLNQVLHGVSREVIITQTDPLFQGIPDRFPAGRYHSWVPDEASFPSCFEVLARGEEESIQALKHKEWPLYGVQFHPESVLTPQGKSILKNWLKITSPNSVSL